MRLFKAEKVKIFVFFMADLGDRAVWGMGLRPLARRYFGFESRLGEWIPVSCECCVVSSRSLWDRLIPPPEDYYRLCVCVCMCVFESDQMKQEASAPTRVGRKF